jgi:hypothetical protein
MQTIEYLELAQGADSVKDRDQGGQFAAEMSPNAGRVQRQIRSHWWKAAAVLASVVISAGAGW